MRAIEFVVSLAPSHGINDRAFFADAVQWLAARYGGAVNILSADIHRDESAPHLHLLLLPLIDGRMKGSDAIGGRAQLAALHGEFHAHVAAPYGLKRSAPRLQGKTKTAAAAAVLQHLRRIADNALRSAAWPVIRESIENDPSPFVAALGLAVPVLKAKPARSMTAIFTSKGKGSNRPAPDDP